MKCFTSFNEFTKLLRRINKTCLQFIFIESKVLFKGHWRTENTQFSSDRRPLFYDRICTYKWTLMHCLKLYWKTSFTSLSHPDFTKILRQRVCRLCRYCERSLLRQIAPYLPNFSLTASQLALISRRTDDLPSTSLKTLEESINGQMTVWLLERSPFAWS